MGFGTVRPGGDHAGQPNPAPDGKSLIRLGSITKVFTTEVLASMVVSGEVKLTDTLGMRHTTFAPDAANVRG